MKHALLIALGGSIGAVLRYFSALAIDSWKLTGSLFPAGTLAVNLTGSLAIGILWGILGNGAFSVNLKAFVFIGLLGSFTTFSTFSMETFQLFKDGNAKVAILYILSSNLLGIVLAWVGFTLSASAYKYIAITP